MSLVADAEHTVAGPIEAVFQRFIDYPTWSEWMPKSFRPLRGPARALRSGDVIFMRIVGAPSLIKIDKVDGPREVVWSGGLPGLLRARHSFVFESVGPATTRIRSVEPWTGILTMPSPVSSRLKAAASKVGRAQLQSFDRWFSAKYASAARAS
jgi:hypothetical protein